MPDWTIVPFAEIEGTAGESTCPLCGHTWTVSLWADCMMPACGCYGQDASPGNNPE